MLIPVLHLPGNCAEAIELYKQALGAVALEIRYDNEAPEGSGIDAKGYIMHAELEIAGSRVNMCDDLDGVTTGDMMLFNLFLESDEAVKTAVQRLAETGTLLTELGPQFWTSMYGVVTDRFGVKWQIMTRQ